MLKFGVKYINYKIRCVTLFLIVTSLFSCNQEMLNRLASGLVAYNNNKLSNSSISNSRRELLCVKYKTNSGWSHGYTVNANVMKGSELNIKTNSYKYNSYSTYVIIFWKKGGVSILEMQMFYGIFSVYGHTAIDQNNIEWEVFKTQYCY